MTTLMRGAALPAAPPAWPWAMPSYWSSRHDSTSCRTVPCRTTPDGG